MRCAAIVVALVFAITTGACFAETLDRVSGKKVLQNETAIQDEYVEKKLTAENKEPDMRLSNDDNSNIGTPVTGVGVMQDGESYDDETGLPDVVDSDGDMEI